MTVSPIKPINAEKIRPEIQSLQSDLVQWRLGFHQRPELGLQEKLTSEFVISKLQEWGIPHETGVAQTGVVALIEGKTPGKVLGIRADMDALPIHEANEVPYRSQHEGIMHACGHDGHTAIAQRIPEVNKLQIMVTESGLRQGTWAFSSKLLPASFSSIGS